MTSQLAYLRNRLSEAASYRMRTFAGGRLASYCRPIWISFLLTELCNAKCVHCDIWKNRGKEDSPSAEQWKAALLQLRQWLGAAHVCLTGGEALLKPYTIDLVKYGHEIGLRIEILTHGYWDDQQKIERLASALPWRVTVSVDGLNETHTLIRGRERFFEKTHTTLQTLKRMRLDQKLPYSILMKTVIMSQNVGDLEPLAHYAQEHGFEILYQPIEQNYNTPDDPEWFRHSETWPQDTEKVVAAVNALVALKRAGLPIMNTVQQLEVMIPYFRNPKALRMHIEGHKGHEQRLSCSALELIQVQANGDVRVCGGSPPVGNIKTATLPAIWKQRPQWWKEGCCMERRCSAAEQNFISVGSL